MNSIELKNISKKKFTTKSIWIVGLVLLTFFFFFADIALGSVSIPLKDIFKIIAGDEVDNIGWMNIIEKIRIPKAKTAILVGCALSVAGLQMQTLFKNPLAGPDVLGLTSGASLGVAIIMLASGSITSLTVIKQMDLLGSWLIVIAASLGSALVLMIILGISLKIKDNVTLLIIGIMLGTLTISFVSILLYFSSPDQIQDYIMWTFGSIGGVTENQLQPLSLIVLIGLFLSIIAAKSLDILLLGENYARTMGLSVNRSRVLIIASTSLLAGSITAFCGPIGFIGLAVPHLTRALMKTSSHSYLIIASCLIGSIIMLLCDVISQLPGSHTTLPINVVTSFIGAPVVIWVIIKKRNNKTSF